MKKNKKSFEEDVPANATGTAVAGTGDDSTTVVKKKKKKVLKRKKLKGTTFVGYPPDPELELKAENTEVAPAVTSTPTPDVTPDTTFASLPVFKVNQDDFAKCQHGKKKYAHWNKFINVKAGYGKRIHSYAKKNPKKSIIVQDDKTGHMVYLKKYSQLGDE